MANPVLIIGTVLFLCSCSSSHDKERPLAAQAAAVDVRANWDKSVKPIAIEVEDCPDGMVSLAVHAEISDAKADEMQAFQGIEFLRSGTLFTASNKRAVTCDTLAKLNICWPARKEACPDSTIFLNAPFGENLYGIEKSREKDSTFLFVSKVETKSSMAVLQLVFETNKLSDILKEVKLQGKKIATSGHYSPYSGDWSNLSCTGSVPATDADCLMANGREHNLYLVPTFDGAPVRIVCRINREDMAVKTTLPPMAAGSLTRLNIRKDGKALRISGSWVATKRPLNAKSINLPDTVKAGYFLRKDGYVVENCDSLCVAMVIQTDGRHGKAVALKDCEGDFTFCDKPLTSGKFFLTVDGERKEGVINPHKSDEIEDSMTIVVSKAMEYPDNSAIGFFDGAALNDALTAKFEECAGEQKSGSNPMMKEISTHCGAYVPSLAEMAMLYCLANPIKGQPDFPDFFIPLEGDYLTCSESSPKSFYSIGFPNGAINGSASKLYAKSKLRLFYLF